MADAGRGLGASRIDLGETSDFDLGGLRVSPARREVSMNGDRRELEPRVAKVLIALASARPAVLSRDRLIEQCWDGRIVGDDALNRCIVALRHLAKQFAPEPYSIETVARVGYSLVEGGRPPLQHRSVRIAVLIGLPLAAVLLAIAWAVPWTRLASVSDKPTAIAVTPFRRRGQGGNMAITVSARNKTIQCRRR